MWATLIRSNCLLIVFLVLCKILFILFFIFFHISLFVFLLSLLAFLFVSYTFSHVSYNACYLVILLYSKPVSFITFQVSLSKFARGIVLCLEVFKLFDFAVIQSLIILIIIIIIIIIRHYINVSFFSTLFVLIFFL